MRKSSSTRASRPRTAWFLIVVKLGGTLELDIGWRYYDGSIGFYSDSAKTCSVKPPWGQVVHCEWIETNNTRGELGEYFKFKNEMGKKCNFKIDHMNPLLFGVNDFTQEITAMRTSKQDRLLAKFLSVVPNSQGFTNHNPEIHTEWGEVKAETSSPALSGEEKEDLKKFVRFARQAAIDVDKKSEALDRIVGSGQKVKKSDGGDGQPVAKKKKVEQMEEEKMVELDDALGVEKSFSSKYFGRADIKLENLSLSSKISIPSNEIKVLGLVNSMQKQFDPSLVCFTVYPADPKKFNSSKLEENNYKIIHGIHRYKALLKLDSKGVLKTLPDMKEKTVTCYIVNVKTDADIVYGNLRGNDLASKSRKPYIHELVFIYSSFKDAVNNNAGKALDLIVRFAKLLLAHPDEVTALRKISSWNSECFACLVSILKRFEVYGTSDCVDSLSRINGKLLRGEKMKVTREMFILIGKSDPEYVILNTPLVLNKTLSLKGLLEGATKVLKTNKTSKLVTSMTNYQTAGQLEMKFPGKFSEEVIKRFDGADIVRKAHNVKAQMLEKYCKSVIEDKDIEPVKFEYVEKLSDVTHEMLAEYDIIVLNCTKFDAGISVEVVDLAVTAKSTLLSVLMLFEDERGHFEAIKYISSLSLSLGVVVKQVFFEAEKPKVLEGFRNNAVYGILLGRVNIFGSPLQVINGSLETSLREFVLKISPLPAKVAFLSE